ncbi:hypothetical protein C9I57_16790 [Trinickia symbiotica]|uniref:Uncharacterized protein n=1 Tax=Trinickia symbiotica TaxID=863227 RepID=A0A2T3XSD6_9BURK|nr:hypothetical protein C9I57_16790 [Trinickia symbiotica]
MVERRGARQWRGKCGSRRSEAEENFSTRPGRARLVRLSGAAGWRADAFQRENALARSRAATS